MKRNIFRTAVVLLLIVILIACGSKSVRSERKLEQSAVWTLSSHYPVNYSSLSYFVTYLANGEPFCLKATHNVKETGMSRRVKESRTVDGIVYALCESKKQIDDKAAYTYYECYTGACRYFIGRESDGFYIENYLSMDDAIALIDSPESPSCKCKLSETEWNAQFRTDACNLEILIRPNDGGALVQSLGSSYIEQTENGETFYAASNGDEIVYTDGVSSVQIMQATRSGQASQNYLTVSECKAILALLGTD